MSNHNVGKSWSRVVQLILGAAFLCLPACGGEDRSGTVREVEPAVESDVTAEQLQQAWTLAKYKVTFDAKAKRFDIVPLETEKSLPGFRPQLHQTVPDGTAANQVQFYTESFSAPQTNCGGFASSFCVDVALKSHYTKRVNLAWVEISGLTGGVTVRNADTRPAALTNYVSGTLPAFNYGQLRLNTKVTKQWVFGVSNPNSFSFTATLKGAPARTAYTVTPVSGTFSNACTTSGMVQLMGENDYSSAVTFGLPFPMSIYDNADITGTASVRGTFSLGTSGVLTQVAQALPSGYLPAGSVAGFWEILRTRPAVTPPAGRVCRVTVGSYPSRNVIMTWENIRFQGGDGVPIMTFSIRLIEGADQVLVYFKQMGNPVTPIARTRGSQATLGIQGYSDWYTPLPCNDANACKQVFHNSTFLPAAAASYPLYYLIKP